jgi:ferredoxin
MTHVICEPCYDCKHTDCVVVCPVECFWQDERMLYIHPDDCIDCEACIPECPVEAIFVGPTALITPRLPAGEADPGGLNPGNVPDKWGHFIHLNAERAIALKNAGQGHVICKQEPQQGPECGKQ